MKVILLSIPILLLFFCGIYRHDIPEERFASLANKPQFDCVGQIFYKDKPRGSCVLITSHDVLTAAHVTLIYHSKGDTITTNGKISIVEKSFFEIDKPEYYSVMFKNKKYSIARIINHPIHNDTTDECDIALMVLTENVDSIQPAVLNTITKEVHKVGTGVGYGMQGTGNSTCCINITPKKLAGNNSIDSLGGMQLNNLPTKLFCDFDSPDISYYSENHMGSSEALPLEYMGGGGDSGGGFFIQKGKTYVLVGICNGYQFNMSTQTGYYGSVFTYTRISALYKWIIEQVHKK